MLGNKEKKRQVADQFVVEITRLRDGPVRIEKDIPLALLAEKLGCCEYEAVAETGRVAVEVSSCGSGVLVSGRVESSIRVQCGTCLADVVLRLAPTVQTYLFPRSEMEKDFDEKELTPDDLNKEWFDGDRIALDELIMDTIMLEMPMNPQCGDSCKGMPMLRSAAQAREIDPRLAPLATLRLEKEK